jgi:hypothetical protein
MARRVGGVAIVDTPEVMVALPLAPNPRKIKGFGRRLYRIWGWRAVDATLQAIRPWRSRLPLQSFARRAASHTYALENIKTLSARYAMLHPFTMPFTLRAGEFLYKTTHS